MRISGFNRRRAEQERQLAARAVTEQARQLHLDLAAIFDARAAERAAARQLQDKTA